MSPPEGFIERHEAPVTGESIRLRGGGFRVIPMAVFGLIGVAAAVLVREVAELLALGNGLRAGRVDQSVSLISGRRLPKLSVGHCRCELEGEQCPCEEMVRYEWHETSQA